MLEMSIINVIFLTNVEKCGRVLITSLLVQERVDDDFQDLTRELKMLWSK